MTNWSKVRKQDEELRGKADSASSALARLRWENTLGATPKVSFTEYARQCGVHLSTVAKYANAWEKISISDRDLPIGEALERAVATADRADVIEVVAKARGVAVATVRSGHNDEVRRIESVARERAEKKGTTVREEAATLAESLERSRRADTSHKEKRRQKTDFRYLELEGYLQDARRSLAKARNVDVEGLEDEHRELLADTIAKVRALLALVTLKFVDAVEVDWDDELQRLTKDGVN